LATIEDHIRLSTNTYPIFEMAETVQRICDSPALKALQNAIQMPYASLATQTAAITAPLMQSQAIMNITLRPTLDALNAMQQTYAPITDVLASQQKEIFQNVITPSIMAMNSAFMAAQPAISELMRINVELYKEMATLTAAPCSSSATRRNPKTRNVVLKRARQLAMKSQGVAMQLYDTWANLPESRFNTIITGLSTFAEGLDPAMKACMLYFIQSLIVLFVCTHATEDTTAKQ